MGLEGLVTLLHILTLASLGVQYIVMPRAVQHVHLWPPECCLLLWRQVSRLHIHGCITLLC
jgi:hypothetical protein